MVFRHVSPSPTVTSFNWTLGSTLAVIGMPLTTLLTRQDLNTVRLIFSIMKQSAHHNRPDFSVDIPCRFVSWHQHHNLFLLCPLPFPPIYRTCESRGHRSHCRCAPRNILPTKRKWIFHRSRMQMVIIGPSGYVWFSDFFLLSHSSLLLRMAYNPHI